MMFPYPYDWVAGWKAKHTVELSKEAEDDLLAWLVRIDELDRERRNECVKNHAQGI